MNKIIIIATSLMISVLASAKDKIPQSHNYVLTPTGQKVDNQSNTKMSYTDNGDGTITDNLTGLMWQKIPVDKNMTWKEAKKYCAKLKLAGHKDWRMPSIKELYSITNFSEGWPYIDTDVFSLVQTQISKDEQYWSSNIYVGEAAAQAPGRPNMKGNGAKQGASSQSSRGGMQGRPSGGMGGGMQGPPSGGMGGGMQGPPSGEMEGGMSSQSQDMTQAFGVNFATGHIKAYPANAQGPIGGKYIRAVRGTEYGVNDFQDNGDGTITDKATDLMWAKDDGGIRLDWAEAKDYANKSTLGGYDDWRLPDVKELQSIVNYNYSPSAKDEQQIGAAIDKIFSCTLIMNEAGKDDYGYYWTNTSARRNKDGELIYAWYVAFGRAVNDKGIDTHGAGAVRFDAKSKKTSKEQGGERYYNLVRLVRNTK